MFCKSDTFEPVITFLSLKDLPSQDADSIKSAINAAFNDISMPEFASKVVFLANDGKVVFLASQVSILLNIEKTFRKIGI